jgi:hypothetical protein
MSAAGWTRGENLWRDSGCLLIFSSQCGGDGFSVFKSGKNQQTGDVDSAVAKLYFAAKGVVQPPKLNRIQVKGL